MAATVPMPLHATASIPVGCMLFSLYFPWGTLAMLILCSMRLSSYSWRTDKVEPLHVDMVTAIIITSLRDSICVVSQRSS